MNFGRLLNETFLALPLGCRERTVEVQDYRRIRYQSSCQKRRKVFAIKAANDRLEPEDGELLEEMRVIGRF